MVKAPMTKDSLMQYTLVALFVITFMSYFVLGLDSLIVCGVAVGVAVLCDILMGMLMGSKGSSDMMSALVFGLIVGLSFTVGEPTLMTMGIQYPGLSEGLEIVILPALISAIGLIVFKKLQGLTGRKYVNPAAAAKLVVLGVLILTVFANTNILFPEEHEISLNLQAPLDQTIFGSTLQTCYGDQDTVMNSYPWELQDTIWTMLVAKYHTWAGGFSSLLVIGVGLGLFVAARRYIKWRITLSYMIATVVVAIVMSLMFNGAALIMEDMILRIMFHLFMGSSIFMAFFMATDPATTPLTHLGQTIFGVGLAVLTMLIQVYMGFIGGSILALIIMNITSPILDNVGKLRPGKREDQKVISDEYVVSTKVTDCMRCGACMNVCVNGLSPILIKQARAKKDANKLMKLEAEYCAGCKNCNVVCPAGIYLEGETLGYNLSKEEANEIEEQFLNGKADKDIGVYNDIFSAKSSIAGQDGGVATALLVSGMEKNSFDAAIVVQRMNGYMADAVVAENVDDLLKAKGTKYVRVSMMSKLQDLLKKGKRKIALVGTPCQIRAARRLQQILLRKHPDMKLTLIGLFCYEILDYKMLKEETMRLLGVNLDDAEKTQITKGKYIVTINGKDYTTKIKELNSAIEKRCLNCPDFPAKYADVSVGSVGSADEYSTVIVRSNVGKELISKVDLEKGEVDLDKIKALFVRKTDRSIQNLAKSGIY